MNKGASLPFHHQHLIRTFLEALLGNTQGINQYSFCFSGIKGQTQVNKHGLQFYSKRVTLVLASMSQQLIDDLTQAMLHQQKLYLGNLILQLESIEEELLPDFGIKNSLLCISPLIINYHYNQQLSKRLIPPTSDEFSDFLYESTMNRMEESAMYTNDEIASFSKFQLIPDQKYIERLNAKGKKYARIYSITYQNVYFEARGYTFPFTLYAAPQVQEFVILNGLGEYTQQGFGMVDFAQTKQIERRIILSLA